MITESLPQHQSSSMFTSEEDRSESSRTTTTTCHNHLNIADNMIPEEEDPPLSPVNVKALALFFQEKLARQSSPAIMKSHHNDLPPKRRLSHPCPRSWERSQSKEDTNNVKMTLSSSSTSITSPVALERKIINSSNICHNGNGNVSAISSDDLGTTICPGKKKEITFLSSPPDVCIHPPHDTCYHVQSSSTDKKENEKDNQSSREDNEDEDGYETPIFLPPSLPPQQQRHNVLLLSSGKPPIPRPRVSLAKRLYKYHQHRTNVNSLLEVKEELSNQPNKEEHETSSSPSRPVSDDFEGLYEEIESVIESLREGDGEESCDDNSSQEEEEDIYEELPAEYHMIEDHTNDNNSHKNQSSTTPKSSKGIGGDKSGDSSLRKKRFRKSSLSSILRDKLLLGRRSLTNVSLPPAFASVLHLSSPNKDGKTSSFFINFSSSPPKSGSRQLPKLPPSVDELDRPPLPPLRIFSRSLPSIPSFDSANNNMNNDNNHDATAEDIDEEEEIYYDVREIPSYDVGGNSSSDDYCYEGFLSYVREAVMKDNNNQDDNDDGYEDIYHSSSISERTYESLPSYSDNCEQQNQLTASSSSGEEKSIIVEDKKKGISLESSEEHKNSQCLLPPPPPPLPPLFASVKNAQSSPEDHPHEDENTNQANVNIATPSSLVSETNQQQPSRPEIQIVVGGGVEYAQIDEVKTLELERKIARETKRLERKQKERADKLRKKFSLTGEEIPVNYAVVKEDVRGTSHKIKVKKGEIVLILRMEGNPPGLCLCKNERDRVGFVEISNIACDPQVVKTIMTNTQLYG